MKQVSDFVSIILFIFSSILLFIVVWWAWDISTILGWLTLLVGAIWIVYRFSKTIDD